MVSKGGVGGEGRARNRGVSRNGAAHKRGRGLGKKGVVVERLHWKGLGAMPNHFEEKDADAV